MENPEKQFEILYGGLDLKVFVKGEGNALTEEFVKVRKVFVRDLQKLADALRDEVREAAFYVDKPLEWIEALSPNHTMEILKAGRLLNKQVFTDWFATRKEWAEMMGIDLQALANQDNSPSQKSSSSS